MVPLNDSSATLPAEISEVERLGLATVPFADFSLPRLADCRVAFACEMYINLEIGTTPQALILGEVKSLYVDDAVANIDDKGRLRVDTAALEPLSRLGAGEYMNFGTIRQLKRPAL
jgi:flavin reductase (DIM6/NTAB) family NADH-FMN oxidoreductase RutF